MTFIGYHGTNTENANKIDNTFFTDSDESAWLGTGVYFFENVENYFDAYEAAKQWSKIVKKNINPVVYKADIVSDVVFDLLKNKEHQNYFVKLKMELQNKHLQAGNSIDDFSDCDVFRQIVRKVEVIRAIVDGKNYSNRLSRSYITIMPQIQLCVCKNSHKVIRNIKRFDVEED